MPTAWANAISATSRGTGLIRRSIAERAAEAAGHDIATPHAVKEGDEDHVVERIPFFMLAACLVGMVALRFMPETAGRSMRGPGLTAPQTVTGLP